jgi:predicted metal-binding membrane protein
MGTTAAQHPGWSEAASGLPSWMLMTVAMMGPSALIATRHVGLNSLRWRRQRAIAEFSAAYLAVWAAFGLLVLAAAAFVPSVPGPAALAVVLAAAAAWQLTPFQTALHARLPP